MEREQTMKDLFSFKIRCCLVLGVLFLWMGAVLCKTYSCSVLRRTALLGETEKLAWREGSIPARRGKILDKNGKILASDKFRCDLVMDYYPLHPHREKRLWKKLRVVDPDFTLKASDTVFPYVIKQDLLLDEIHRYRKLFLGSPEVRVHGYFQRATHPGLEEVLGATALNDRKESVGISGLEKKHDMTLSGRSGQFVVMLNRRGSWVNDTLKILTPPRNGLDVRLGQSLEEMVKK